MVHAILVNQKEDVFNLYESARLHCKSIKKQPSTRRDFKIHVREDNNATLELFLEHHNGKTFKVNDLLPRGSTFARAPGFGVRIDEDKTDMNVYIAPEFSSYEFFVPTVFHEMGHMINNLLHGEQEQWIALKKKDKELRQKHARQIQDRMKLAEVEKKIRPESTIQYKELENMLNNNRLFKKDLYLPLELFKKEHTLRAYAERTASAIALKMLREIDRNGWNTLEELKKTHYYDIYLCDYEIAYTKAHLAVQEVSLENIKRRIIGKEPKIYLPTKPLYINKLIWEEAKRLGITKYCTNTAIQDINHS